MVVAAPARSARTGAATPSRSPPVRAERASVVWACGPPFYASRSHRPRRRFIAHDVPPRYALETVETRVASARRGALLIAPVSDRPQHWGIFQCAAMRGVGLLRVAHRHVGMRLAVNGRMMASSETSFPR